MSIGKFITTALLWLVVAVAQAQNISTLAGSGTAGFSGDGAAALSATLAQPQDVALDTFGNIYIADAANQRVRKVTAATGIISTIAGTGTAGFSGDGAAATAAKLHSPIGLTVDKEGNVYIADNGNNCIRKVSAATGIISTVAGIGGVTAGYSGDGGLATAALFYGPYDIALDDSENLFIADVSNQRIRKVNKKTGIVTTVAGSGTAGFSGDGGLATSAKLNNPFSVVIDGANNLYITDAANRRVRKVDASTGFISTIAGTGGSAYSGDGSAATAAQFILPYSIALDRSNNVYVSDFYNHRIRKITVATGIISTITGTGVNGYSGDGGLATAAKINFPKGIFVDKVNNVYIADEQNNRVRFVCNAATIPDAPKVSSPLVLCTGSSPSPLTAIGSNLKWYSSATGGTGTSVAPTPSVASVGTMSYWVSQSSACGESPRAELVVQVLTAPGSPSVMSPIVYCQGAIAVPLSASGTSTLHWYTTATGGTASLVAPIPSTSTAGTQFFYVSQGTDACQSTRLPITVVVNPSPIAPIVTDVQYCIAATSSYLSALGANLKWYSTAIAGLADTIAPRPSTLKEGTQSYYVSQTNSYHCESPRSVLNVTTYARPKVSITAKTAPSFFVCKGATLSLKTVVSPYGLNYQWQLAGIDILGALSDSFVVAAAGEYSVIVSNAPNCSDTARVLVEQDSSTIKTMVSPTDVYICDGVGIKLFSTAAIGSHVYSYQWYKDGVALSNADTTTTLVVRTKGDYQIVVANELGCSARSNVSIVHTYPSVLKPIISNFSGTLSISNTYASYQWYRNNKPITGATLYFYPLMFDGNYYVTVEDINGCKGISDTLEINSLSINHAQLPKDIQIYPNPTSGILAIKSNLDISVKVFDVLGRCIAIPYEHNMIDLSAQADGTYYVQFINAAHQYLGKEIIVKSKK